MNGSIYDLYEFYLEPRDLKEKAHVVVVESVRVDSVINPRARKPEKKIVLRFVNRRKSMILNKTQAGALAEITGTDEYMTWKGAEVVLVEDRAVNGRPTIKITTREESGDIDLMFQAPPSGASAPPPPSGRAPLRGGRNEMVSVRVTVPKGWWDLLEMEGQAVKYAAEVWDCGEAEAYGRIQRAIQAEDVSDAMPPEQFKDWVKLVKDGGVK